MRDDEKKKLHENIKQEIRSLLISSPKTKYGGLSGSLLYSDYKQLNCGKEVPYVELGFHSFLALLRSMPDVVRIEHKENSPSYRVHPVYDESTAHIQKMVLEQNDKYEYQNRLYSQNWYSNNQIPMNLYNKDQLPFFHNYLPCCAYNSVQTNFPVFQHSFHHTFNNSLRRPFPQELPILNKRKVESTFEPYLLLTPVTPINHQKQDEKMNYNDFNLLPYLSSKSMDNHEICSTPATFLETPPNFSFDDYRLNESIKLSEKDIYEEINTNSCINNHVEEIQDDPLLMRSINIIPNELPNLEKDQPLTSTSITVANNSIISPTNNTNILPSIIDEKSPSDNEIIVEIPHSNKPEQSKIDENENLIKRLNDAIRECINFRYIHRLCEVKFVYRYYPLSNEIFSIKSKFEQIAFNQYQQELEEFEKTSQLNSSIDDEKCQMMFDQYISLQRNYYYMIKLLNKKHR